jgi:ribosomal protein S18 acetylase RimI-like enzyme
MAAMTADLIVRSYRDEDEEQVVALWAIALPSRSPWNEPYGAIRRKVAEGDDLFLVGELDRQVVATVMAGYDGHRGWIYSVAVAPACRRRGYAGTMIREAERRLRAAGCPKINLQVLGSNREVVALYEKLGYVVEDRISMGKPLP